MLRKIPWWRIRHGRKRVNLLSRKYLVPVFPKSRKQVIHFLHIRKTGGTALLNSLRAFEATDFVLLDQPHSVRLMDVPRGDQVIFFLRNPAQRFVSGFYDRLRQGLPRYNRPWSRAEAFVFSRFKTPNQLALGLTSKNRTTVRDAEYSISKVRHLSSTYSQSLGSIEYIRSRLDDLYFVGFQENLDQDFQRLKKKMSMPGSIELTRDNRLAHKMPVHFDRRLSDQALHNLEAIYSEDYRIYNFLKDFAQKRWGLQSTRTSNRHS
jgi:hypothetical protein